MKTQEQNIANEPFQDYEKAELDLIRTALNRTYEERFNTMANLMKRNLKFRKAVITHKTLPSSE